MAPSNQTELIKMIKTTTHIDDRPSAFRYPRGTGILLDEFNQNKIEIGKGYIVIEGNKIAILI